MRLLFCACLITLAGSAASAQSSAVEVETDRYLSCLERINADREAAFEDALAWRMEGGGWPAAHCEARALIALGDAVNGAAMLEDQASADAGVRDEAIRVSMLVEAGDAWLTIERTDDAQRAFTAALDLSPNDASALLGQAETKLALGLWDEAESAATASIEQAPTLAGGWRLRALARLETGALDAAWQDMEAAREIEPDNIDILVLRGRINEARRLAAQPN
ncbi:tetratricopeptide repeat protein [uncultured Maricaulis sp.]|uniref:tetratricopeptide repeat protein n=1 Tax=uncultured Maricaulis sp. TaxID=174710 RepID=UPI0030DA9F22|tara:strand:+ start:19074 stop:19739 length:666 start_codon:yes stop_codon:yes gene_type:complete